jgi:hypothetical protein
MGAFALLFAVFESISEVTVTEASQAGLRPSRNANLPQTINSAHSGEHRGSSMNDKRLDHINRFQIPELGVYFLCPGFANNPSDILFVDAAAGQSVLSSELHSRAEPGLLERSKTYTWTVTSFATLS